MLNVVVSITEIIEYYKNGYMSATVGTRRSLVQLRSESSESALQTYNHFYNISPIISVI